MLLLLINFFDQPANKESLTPQNVFTFIKM